ncbi:hypothetical protein KTT_08040 [Tengunoibacter tsumagoiensis]|uniref:Uncharacterized protein n=2 Tax=Tengunoibacter tsumagoiensis TaxID=2014871 RepID=A0A401ZVL1_9CHLR|nr:hypothetical protein KTT_08040 [Tengunoibacter tsumagoiensis]
MVFICEAKNLVNERYTAYKQSVNTVVYTTLQESKTQKKSQDLTILTSLFVPVHLMVPTVEDILSILPSAPLATTRSSRFLLAHPLKT